MGVGEGSGREVRIPASHPKPHSLKGSWRPLGGKAGRQNMSSPSSTHRTPTREGLLLVCPCGRILSPSREVCVLRRSVASDSLWSHGRKPTMLLCPWEFSRQEYWKGLSFPPPVDLPLPRIKPESPTLAGRFFTNELPRKLYVNYISIILKKKTTLSWIRIPTKPLPLTGYLKWRKDILGCLWGWLMM